MAQDTTQTTDNSKAAGSARSENTRQAVGLRALAATLSKVTRPLLGRRGFAEGALTSEWPAIVGTEIAARCRPERLTFGHAAERRDGTLTLRVEGAFSTELQHLAPQIIERINGYYGYRAVVRLRLHQGAPAERAAPTTPGPALAPEQEAALEHRLNEVEDPDLRTALGRLGRAVARRTQT